jgi:hypothetical protein
MCTVCAWPGESQFPLSFLNKLKEKSEGGLNVLFPRDLAVKVFLSNIWYCLVQNIN